MSELLCENFQFLAEFHCEAGSGSPVPPSLRAFFCRDSTESAIGWGFQFPDREALPRGYIESIGQRRELLARLDRPELSLPVLWDDESRNRFTLHCRASEGELLASYFVRPGEVSEAFAIRIMKEVLEFILTLTGVPRVLSCVELEDFRISLKGGFIPGVKFCPAYPLLREERPLSDFQIARKWTELMARLHAFIKQNGEVEFSQTSWKDSALFRGFINEFDGERERSLNDRIHDIIRVLEGDQSQTPGEKKGLDFLPSSGLMPIGPLAQHLRDGFLRAHPEMIPYGQRDGSTACLRFSSFVIEFSSGSGTIDRQGYLLPPEQWFETSLVDPVNRRLSHPFLRSHHNCVRVRSVYCDDLFTVLMGDVSPGLPLPVILSAFDGVTRAELLLISGKLHRALEQFESADFTFPLLTPWQVEIHLESSQSTDSREHLFNGEISSWPPWDVKLRVEKPTESLVDEECGHSWQFVFDKLQGKFFPALMSWMLDWKRFQRAARSGSLEGEPLNPDLRLDALFKAAAEHLDVANTGHREKFYSLIIEGLSGDSETGKPGKK